MEHLTSNSEPSEDLLLSLIGLFSLVVNKETELVSDYIRQIRALINDAVEKINTNMLSSGHEGHKSGVVSEQLKSSNVFYMPDQVLGRSKKIDGLLNVLQIDDITSQIVDELLAHMHASQELMGEILTKLEGYQKQSDNTKNALLLEWHHQLAQLLEKKRSVCVRQEDLNEGGVELF
jgi:hypothetical protein